MIWETNKNLQVVHDLYILCVCQVVLYWGIWTYLNLFEPMKRLLEPVQVSYSCCTIIGGGSSSFKIITITSRKKTASASAYTITSEHMVVLSGCFFACFVYIYKLQLTCFVGYSLSQAPWCNLSWHLSKHRHQRWSHPPTHPKRPAYRKEPFFKYQTYLALLATGSGSTGSGSIHPSVRCFLQLSLQSSLLRPPPPHPRPRHAQRPRHAPHPWGRREGARPCSREWESPRAAGSHCWSPTKWGICWWRQGTWKAKDFLESSLAELHLLLQSNILLNHVKSNMWQGKTTRILQKQKHKLLYIVYIVVLEANLRCSQTWGCHG